MVVVKGVIKQLTAALSLVAGRGKVVVPMVRIESRCVG